MSWGNRPWGSVRSWTMSPRPAASFSPLQLTNLRGWWKSDTGITIATGVSAWADQSGNGNNLVQGTGVRQPALVAAQINGLPAVSFDGSDDAMAVAFALVQPETVFMVVRQPTWVSNTTIFDGASGANMMRVLKTSGGVSPQLSIRTTSVVSSNSDLAVGTFGLMTAVFNGASSALQINGNAALTGNVGASNGGGITLGATGGLTAPGTCDIAEVIVMAAAATAQEILNVRAYVTARYGFSA